MKSQPIENQNSRRSTMKITSNIKGAMKSTIKSPKIQIKTKTTNLTMLMTSTNTSTIKMISLFNSSTANLKEK